MAFDGISGNGSVSDNNISWNRKLAEELDEADGKKDGKISASIWNEFLAKNGSKGNKIKKYINVNSAENSFNYYNKTKDAGNIDWKNNWQTMINEFKNKKEDLKSEEKIDDSPNPKIDEKQKPAPAQKTDNNASSQPASQDSGKKDSVNVPPKTDNSAKTAVSNESKTVKDSDATKKTPDNSVTLKSSANETNYNTNTKKLFTDIIEGTTNKDSINLYGITHYKYNDCPKSRLTSVGNGIVVRDDCASAFQKMQSDAKKDGVNLKIVSGYRSSNYQKQVFKRKFKNSQGKEIFPSEEQMKARLKYSAPSGYSEHHTGLAIDINSTEDSFKNTKEYQWLMEHAQEYGFEMSFPENNDQGLGFEPWHWRYVGKNEENSEIFREARSHDSRFNL